MYTQHVSVGCARKENIVAYYLAKQIFSLILPVYCLWASRLNVYGFLLRVTEKNN